MALFKRRKKKAGDSPNEYAPQASRALTRTLGVTYSEEDYEKEPLPELWPPQGLEKYRKMRTNDPIIGGLLLRIENILKTTSYTITNDPDGFIRKNLENLPHGFSSLINDMASALTYGFSLNEKVFYMEGGQVILKDLPPRHQLSVSEFTPTAVRQGNKQIPRDKLIHFIPIKICRNPYGQSLLRAVYKPYYYKKAVEAAEATGADRDLAGMPVITPPEGFDFTRTDPSNPRYDPHAAATLQWAQKVVSSIRKDTLQGIVKPFGWTLELLRAQGQPLVDTNQIIARYDTQIAAGMLENFATMNLTKSNSSDMLYDFRANCDAFLAQIAECLNTQLLKDLADLNDIYPYPQLSFSKLAHESITDIASFIGRLISVGAIVPSTTLEKELLAVSKFTYDPDTQRAAIIKGQIIDPQETKPQN